MSWTNLALVAVLLGSVRCWYDLGRKVNTVRDFDKIQGSGVAARVPMAMQGIQAGQLWGIVRDIR